MFDTQIFATTHDHRNLSTFLGTKDRTMTRLENYNLLLLLLHLNITSLRRIGFRKILDKQKM